MHINFIRKTSMMRPVGRQRRKWGNNIKMRMLTGLTWFGGGLF